jgi:hypothetical protein
MARRRSLSSSPPQLRIERLHQLIDFGAGSAVADNGDIQAAVFVPENGSPDGGDNPRHLVAERAAAEQSQIEPVVALSTFSCP